LRPTGEIEEKQCLAGLFSGTRTRKGLRLSDEPRPITFLDCKGTIEGILDLFHLRESIVWSRAKITVLHPGRAAELLRDDEKIGYLGESHPDLDDEFGVPLFMAFELDFEKLLEYSPRQIKVSSLPRYPAVERDFALVVDQTVTSQQIIGCINELGQTLIERVEVFDEYRGDSIPEGKKSLAYKISYRADDRTLTDGEVNTVHQQLVDHIGKVFEAQRRS
jgi:phenylalanyl-tRNA synthetase beta chain